MRSLSVKRWARGMAAVFAISHSASPWGIVESDGAVGCEDIDKCDACPAAMQ
jgi:hypothetical protein